jgi:hypothetical protein
LLDHGGNSPMFVASADDHRALSPVTIVDEPCIYSDELNQWEAVARKKS